MTVLALIAVVDKLGAPLKTLAVSPLAKPLGVKVNAGFAARKLFVLLSPVIVSVALVTLIATVF